MKKEIDWNVPQILDIPIAHDQRGNLSVVEGGELIPFDIKRLYYLYDVPGGATRGGHAHRNLRQLPESHLPPMSGTFQLTLQSRPPLSDSVS